jgi:hypothetical protein
LRFVALSKCSVIAAPPQFLASLPQYAVGCASCGSGKVHQVVDSKNHLLVGTDAAYTIIENIWYVLHSG